MGRSPRLLFELDQAHKNVYIGRSHAQDVSSSFCYGSGGHNPTPTLRILSQAVSERTSALWQSQHSADSSLEDRAERHFSPPQPHGSAALQIPRAEAVLSPCPRQLLVSRTILRLRLLPIGPVQGSLVFEVLRRRVLVLPCVLTAVAPTAEWQPAVDLSNGRARFWVLYP
jgi:hypothetical protein